MFARDDDAETIREAMRAGVSAYVVDGLDAERVKADRRRRACARFEEFQRLRDELADGASRKLAERKLVERAKGLLMKATRARRGGRLRRRCASWR